MFTQILDYLIIHSFFTTNLGFQRIQDINKLLTKQLPNPHFFKAIIFSDIWTINSTYRPSTTCINKNVYIRINRFNEDWTTYRQLDIEDFKFEAWNLKLKEWKKKCNLLITRNDNGPTCLPLDDERLLRFLWLLIIAYKQ